MSSNKIITLRRGKRKENQKLRGKKKGKEEAFGRTGISAFIYPTLNCARFCVLSWDHRRRHDSTHIFLFFPFGFLRQRFFV